MSDTYQVFKELREAFAEQTLEQRMRVRNKFSPRIAPIAMVGESKTLQSFRDEVNINTIVNKYNKTGIVTHVQRVQAKFGDFTELANYAENLDKVAAANQAFEQLPAALRDKFQNNIQGFFKWLENPNNREEATKLGFLKRSSTGTPVDEKPSVDEAPTAPPPPSSSTSTSSKKQAD